MPRQRDFTASLAAFVLGVPALFAEAPVDFARDVRPILAKNCFACHGADGAHRMAGLRLDRRDAAVLPRKKGHPAIVPGDLAKSELASRISTADESERMPPKDTGNRLTPEQIAILKRWIREGAPYAEHYAFVKPTSPALPRVATPGWARNPVDLFVQARLERSGMRPGPEADPYTLLRRVSLDLRGLPPTPEEVKAFRDDLAPGAYERAVDRFLQDSAYGERWARMWLDLARYADSAGYGSDPLRTIWRYRDWVIGAFNRNLPYDQFSLEQLAGDLLPNATLDQKIATAFHRNTMTNTEGGTDDEEFRVAAVKDRVDTTLQVWMGVTMGCAKCHNHKYDPITQQEYYRFYAFFNQTADNDSPAETPVLSAPTPEQERLQRQIDADLAALKKKLTTTTAEIEAAQRTWESSLASKSKWRTLDPKSSKSSAGSALRKLEDGSLIADGPNPAESTYTIRFPGKLVGLTGLRLEAIPDPSLPAGGSGRAEDGSFVVTKFSAAVAPVDGDKAAPRGRFVRIELPGDSKILSLAEVQVFHGEMNLARKGQASQSSTAYEGAAERAIDGNTSGDYFGANSTSHTAIEANPWWEVKLAEASAIDRVVLWNRTDGGVGVRLAGCRVAILDEQRRPVWQQDAPEPPNPKLALQPAPTRSLAIKQALADFSQDKFDVASTIAPMSKTGWGVAPKQKEAHAAVFVLAERQEIDVAHELVVTIECRSQKASHNLGRFRLSATDDPAVQQRGKLPPDVLAALDLSPANRTPAQRERLAEYYRGIAPLLEPVRAEIAKLEKSRPMLTTVPVMVELPVNQRRETKLMVKGNFLSTGEKVDPGTPASFHPLAESLPRDRIAVARWLFDENNPLTGRVAANRLWAQLWGVGLVETEEDFGTQGELPSHPELLDWLALEYRRLGWDTKAFLKMLVTSSTYRQSSFVTPEQAERDPRNRLLGRGPRFRLEAEMVRDQALALSGLLSRKMNGPSVFPPQPAGLWQAAFNGQRTWSTSTGEDRYRRGLYVFWRRTIPYPSMATFDAPSRETCSVRRIRTNTPLQAFVTMNDPVYVEASQALARRIVREGGKTAAEQARFALELCLARPPRPEQLEQVERLLRSELAHYRKNAKEATLLATDPLGPLPPGGDAIELAAWTVVANVILNLDAVLTKG